MSAAGAFADRPRSLNVEYQASTAIAAATRKKTDHHARNCRTR
jgi:hypothetical protein